MEGHNSRTCPMEDDPNKQNYPDQNKKITWRSKNLEPHDDLRSQGKIHIFGNNTGGLASPQEKLDYFFDIAESHDVSIFLETKTKSDFETDR